MCIRLLFVLGLAATTFCPWAVAAQRILPTPPGSIAFGWAVAFLPNGNLVVTDPMYGEGTRSEIGAAYLLQPDGTVISKITGSQDQDRIGTSIVVLTNGNFLIGSHLWNAADGTADVGAVTFGDADTGFGNATVVSVDNSITGASSGEFVGGVVPLLNGHYVVVSSHWKFGTVRAAGAAVWGNGDTGSAGRIDETNALHGTSADDGLDMQVIALADPVDGNYVVAMKNWDRNGIRNAGAVAWRRGTAASGEPVSLANALLGARQDDEVGWAVVRLSNGHYVVSSPRFDRLVAGDAGAVTWGSGDTGVAGEITFLNSLIGTQTNDAVGIGIVALTNGNYVVRSPNWDNGNIQGAGAATWREGTVPTSGVVDAANSLVGGAAGDGVGISGIALSNGNYVIGSPSWDDVATADAGAVTWGDGSMGSSGVVEAANSLVGASTGNRVGLDLVPLSNGNFVAISPLWSSATVQEAGAVTWVDGSKAVVDTVAEHNSLVGNRAGDLSGANVVASDDGHYLLMSPRWDDAALADVGALTWLDGSLAMTGKIGSDNSLIGTAANTATFASVLSPRRVVAFSSSATNGAITVFESGSTRTGSLSASNSLFVAPDVAMRLQVGITRFGDDGVIHLRAQSNGNITGAGAVALVRGSDAPALTLTPDRTILGTTAQAGQMLAYSYDPTSATLAVGEQRANRVTLLTDVRVFADGFESL